MFKWRGSHNTLFRRMSGRALVAIAALSFVVILVVASPALAQGITLAYPSFTPTDMQGIALTGGYGPNHVQSTTTTFSAYRDAATSAIRLTNSSYWLSGAAIFQQAIDLPADRSFSAFFTIHIHDHSAGPADGIVFMLQPRRTVTLVYGGGMGFLGLADSRPNSLEIEFDTFSNPGADSQNGVNIPVYDPNANHVGINLNGAARSVATASPPGNVSLNGNPWNVWVDYNAPAKVLEVRMSQTMVRPAAATLSYSADLSRVLGHQVYAGFAASTGSFYETHDVKALYLDNKYVSGGLTPATVSYTMGDQTAPVLTLPGTLTAQAVGKTGATVSFASQIKAVDDVDGAVAFTTSTASGSVFPLGSTKVTVTASDQSGNVATGSFLVKVVDTTAPVISGLKVAGLSRGASGPGYLFDILRLRISDGASVLYDGDLRAFTSLALGTWQPKEKHSYTFVVTFPDGGIPKDNYSGDNAYQGSSATVEFRWIALQH